MLTKQKKTKTIKKNLFHFYSDLYVSKGVETNPVTHVIIEYIKILISFPLGD